MVSAKDTIKTPAYFLEKICERSIKGKRSPGWLERRLFAKSAFWHVSILNFDAFALTL